MINVSLYLRGMPAFVSRSILALPVWYCSTRSHGIKDRLANPSVGLPECLELLLSHTAPSLRSPRAGHGIGENSEHSAVSCIRIFGPNLLAPTLASPWKVDSGCYPLPSLAFCCCFGADATPNTRGSGNNTCGI